MCGVVIAGLHEVEFWKSAFYMVFICVVLEFDANID